MINKVNITGPKYLSALNYFDLAHDVASILDSGEYVIEYTKVHAEDCYFRLFFKYQNTYRVRYTGKSHESCIAYLDSIPRSSSVVSHGDIINACQHVQKGVRKLYKYPVDDNTLNTLKNFV